MALAGSLTEAWGGEVVAKVWGMALVPSWGVMPGGVVVAKVASYGKGVCGPGEGLVSQVCVGGGRPL